MAFKSVDPHTFLALKWHFSEVCVDPMYVELSYWPLDMFLYTSEAMFTQILASRYCLSKNVKNGTFGEKSELFY